MNAVNPNPLKLPDSMAYTGQDKEGQGRILVQRLVFIGSRIVERGSDSLKSTQHPSADHFLFLQTAAMRSARNGFDDDNDNILQSTFEALLKQTGNGGKGAPEYTQNWGPFPLLPCRG